MWDVPPGGSCADQERGWQARGIDVSAWAVEQARSRLGVEALCGEFLDVGGPEHQYDVIHLNHVLEHVENPLAYVQHARQLLSRGGWLIVEVPNEFASWSCRYLRATTPVLRAPCRARWPDKARWRIFEALHPEPSGHVTFFTPVTLRRLVGQAGLRVRRCATAPQTFAEWRGPERRLLPGWNGPARGGAAAATSL